MFGIWVCLALVNDLTSVILVKVDPKHVILYMLVFQ